MKLTDSLKKTIIGVVAAIAGVAVTLGWLTPEQAGTVNEATTSLLEHIGGVILGVIALFGIFTGRNTAD